MDEKSEQLQGHLQYFKRVIYTNGLKWQLYKGQIMEWEIELGVVENLEITWYANKWNCLLKELDSIDWLDKS